MQWRLSRAITLPKLTLSSLKRLPQPCELGACHYSHEQEKSDKHDQHGPLWITWLVLEFISPLKGLWSPLGGTSCCWEVSSLHVLSNPCTEQEHKLWNSDVRGCSSLFVYAHLKKSQFSVLWGKKEQFGSFSSIFSLSAFLEPKAMGGLAGCWLPAPGKSSPPALQSFLGNEWGIVGLQGGSLMAAWN